MSKKFYAINRETQCQWKPDKSKEHQFLVMYDSGYLAVITEPDGYGQGHSITPLDPKKWVVGRQSLLDDITKTRIEAEEFLNSLIEKRRK